MPFNLSGRIVELAVGVSVFGLTPPAVLVAAVQWTFTVTSSYFLVCVAHVWWLKSGSFLSFYRRFTSTLAAASVFGISVSPIVAMCHFGAGHKISEFMDAGWLFTFPVLTGLGAYLVAGPGRATLGLPWIMVSKGREAGEEVLRNGLEAYYGFVKRQKGVVVVLEIVFWVTMAIGVVELYFLGYVLLGGSL